jgi:prepilin-type processing-associated H-X9-DG protein/prepilin-type N-terminal cleavage/methylation domain-containing protein
MKRPCFTLIELIVVISIIALLMAILATFLQVSRQQTKTLLCGSNIKQLLLALLSYDTENLILPCSFDDRVDPNNCPGDQVYDRVGWWWFQSLGGFNWNDENKRTILRCPSNKLKSPTFRENILFGNYGVNQFICKSTSGLRRKQAEYKFIGAPLSCDDIPRAGEVLLIVDSGYSMINWWHACDSPPEVLSKTSNEETAYIPGLRINDGRDLWHEQEEDAIEGRHLNKTVNVGFVDGHVKCLKADDLLVEKIGEDEYKNLSPLWVPKIK